MCHLLDKLVNLMQVLWDYWIFLLSAIINHKNVLIWFPNIGVFIATLGTVILHLLYLLLSEGFQLLDALLCYTCIYRKHSEIWSATIFPGTYTVIDRTILMPITVVSENFNFWPAGLDWLQAAVLSPSSKSEKKVRSILESLSDSANRQVSNLCIHYE